MTPINPPSIDKILVKIAPRPVTLPFISIEGKNRYTEFMRIDPP